MAAFVYDGFPLEELQEMLRLLALSYADLHTKRKGKRKCKSKLKERE